MARQGGVPTTLFLESALVGVFLAALFGARARDFAEIELKAAWAFIVAALIEGGLAWSTSTGWIAPQVAAPIAKTAVVVLVGYGLWQNRHLRTIWLAAFGLLLNTIAMTANGGQMPVSADALIAAGLEGFLRFMQTSSDAVHNLIGPDTRLWFLTDVIPLPWFKKVISPGDAFLFIAVLLFFPEATQRVIRNRRA
nr:DUF5317 domain-containing protein [Oceanithermus profundus]